MKRKKIFLSIRKFFRFLLRCICQFIVWNIEMNLQRKMEERKKMKTKLKYFKPTIKEGFFYKSVSWTMRDRPLTEKDLEELDNN